MIKAIYSRVWKVLRGLPVRLWGYSLLYLLLCALSCALTVIPVLTIALTLLLSLGMSQIFLRAYRGEAISVELLFAGFQGSFWRNLGGMAWARLFQFLWGLIPIVGPVFAVIRGYEYAFAPYILMNRPEVAATEARLVSRRETGGWKGLMFCAELLLGLAVLVLLLALLLLSFIPLIGAVFGLLLFLTLLAAIAFLPLCYGLLRAAFYEEIQSGSLAAQREAGAAPAAESDCAVCGGPLDAKARFCPNCGSPRDRSEE